MSASIDHLLMDSTPNWQYILEQILIIFECQTGTLHRFDETDQHLHLITQIGVPEVLLPMITHIPNGKGIAGAAAQQRQAVELCNLQQDLGGVAKPDARKTQVQGSIAVPLIYKDQLLGTLGIGKIQPYEFNEEEKTKLFTLARAIAKTFAHHN